MTDLQTELATLIGDVPFQDTFISERDQLAIVERLASALQQVGWLVDEEDEYYFVAPDDNGEPAVRLPQSARPVYRFGTSE